MWFLVVNFKGQLKAEDKVDIKKGIKLIEYRGPDDQNIISNDNFCFGFNRLSIIDLDAENKPYYTSDKSCSRCVMVRYIIIKN